MSSTTTTSDRLAPLLGARIRRIDLPEVDLVAMTVALESTEGARDEAILLLSFSAAHPGLGLTASRPKGAPASAFCQLLRKHLEGGVIVAIDTTDATLTLRTRRGPERRALVLGEGSLSLDMDGRVHSQRAPVHELLAIPRWTLPAEGSREALETAGLSLTSARAGGDRDDEVNALLTALRKLGKRLEQRARAVEKDLARSEDIPELRTRGTLVLSHLDAIARGATHVSLEDVSTDPPRIVAIALDPARDPREQARAWFDRARKLERGDTISRGRLASARAVLARTHALTLALARGDATGEELAEAHALIASETRSPRDATIARGKRSKNEPRLPYRRIVGSGGREIRVGRGARDNDALTQKHAAPHDLWLHARGVPGAHVVVPLTKGEACPPELLLDAATLAAHFSDRKNDRVVEVDHVARGHVRKRKGMPPGKVEVTHPKTIAVRVEPKRLERLLGRTPV